MFTCAHPARCKLDEKSLCINIMNTEKAAKEQMVKFSASLAVQMLRLKAEK